MTQNHAPHLRQPEDHPKGWQIEMSRYTKKTWEEGAPRTVHAGQLRWLEKLEHFAERDQDPGSCWLNVSWKPEEHELPKAERARLKELQDLRDDTLAGDEEAKTALRELSFETQVYVDWLLVDNVSVPMELLEPEHIPALQELLREMALKSAQEDAYEESEDLEDLDMHQIIERYQIHPAEWIQTPWGGKALIDLKMIPTIQALWAMGVSTKYCCQGERHGGAYLRGTGRLPETLRNAITGAGFKHELNTSTWTVWDSAAPHRAEDQHQAFMRLMSDITEGLENVDSTGERYRAPRTPAPDFETFAKEMRELISAQTEQT